MCYNSWKEVSTMGEVSVERLEHLRYIIIKKRNETLQWNVYSEKALKEREERLEALEIIDYFILEQLRKILY